VRATDNSWITATDSPQDYRRIRMTPDGRVPKAEVADLAIRILGSFELRVDGTPTRIGSASQRRILSILALQAGTVVSTTTLIDALWPHEPPHTAVVSLRNQISRLRVVLGRGSVDAVPPGYALRIPQGNVDAFRFEQIVSDRSSTEEALEEALSMWRGAPLGEFALDEWARPTVTRITELHLVAQERRLALLMERGEHQEVVAYSESLVAALPERESVHALLMTALARTGRAGEALRVFQKFRSHLVEEIGVEPSEALRRIERAVLDGEIDVVLPEFPVSQIVNANRASQTSNSRPSFPASLVVSADTLPLTGRSEALALLLKVLKSTQSGEGQSVVVLGEAGIGKSRLVAEFATRAHNAGVPIVFGQCDEDLRAGLAPFLQIARQLATARSPGLDTSSLEKLSIGQTEATGAQTTNHDDSFSRYEAFANYLSLIAEVWGSLVLIIEDMHWADRDSVALLRYLVRSRSSGPIMIVATSRDEPFDTSGAFSRLLASLHTTPGVTRLELPGLDVDAVSELVDHVGSKNRTGEAVHQQTAGNPFFVCELLAGVEGETIPSSVRDVVTARAARLGATTHETLRTAAVIGQEFELAILMATSEQPEDTLLDQLQHAVDARIVTETGIDVWRFRHALLRDALYSDLPDSRRARLHATIGNFIERERPNDVVSLAFHFDRAGLSSREKTLMYLKVVGSGARSSNGISLENAATALGRAVELTDELYPLNVVERAEIRVQAATVQNAAGDLAWRETSLSAVDLGMQANRPDLVIAAALTGTSSVAVRGLYEVDRESVQAVETALGVATSENDQARLLARLSALIIDDGNGDEAAHVARRALAAARRSGNDTTLATVLTGTLRALCRPSECHDIASRLKELDQLIDHLDAASLRREGAIHRATEYARLGDLAGVDRCIAVLDESAQRGSVLARRSRSQLQFYRQLVIGDTAGAEKHAAQAHQDGVRTSFVGAELVWRAQMLNLGVATGRPIDVPRLGGKDPLAGSSMSGGYRAGLLIAQGKGDEALELLSLAAGENFRNVPENYQWWSAMLTWAAVPFYLQITGVNDPRLAPAANEVERLLLPHRGTFSVAQVSLEVPVDVGLGYAAYGAREFARATEYFKSAVTLCDRTGVGVHGSSARVYLALSFAQHHGVNARKYVLELLDEAENWATEHGTTRNQGLSKIARSAVGG
jgi:DNA-binding SARP family transcriptional activator